MAAISTVSVRPSTASGSTSARSGYPDWVLLTKRARISGDQNATTAVCRTRDGQPVAVSFWLADPPNVSHFSIHCPGIEEEDFADPPPFVIAAEGAFVLFCITLDGSDHHFVYSARGNPTGKKNKPSLHIFPGPKPAVEAFESQQFGMLPLGDEHYAVAFLDHRWDSRGNAWARMDVSVLTPTIDIGPFSFYECAN
ncbi:hypothetical protein ACQ4PT_022061 [Festuca glaucescens]